MTRKEKFLQVIKEKGYNSIVDLMIPVESLILGSKQKGYEKATTCKNYYSMIEGTSRDFPREYIIALEKVLDMKFIDMINPFLDTKPKLKYDSLRTIAFANDYDKTKEFALVTSNDDYIIYNSDEYNKFFMDYVLEYSAINCLRYIVEEDDIKLQFNNMLMSKNNRFLSSRDLKQLPIDVANLIYKYDDVDLFNRIFNPFEAIRFQYYDNETLFDNENFAKGILRTNIILESLFKTKKLIVCWSFSQEIL